jgi:hypothetical protein
MNTAQVAAAVAPFANRHNVRTFDLIGPAQRDDFARHLAREAGCPGEFRYVGNILTGVLRGEIEAYDAA